MFVHLKVFTEYSISRGILRIPEIVQEAKNNQMPAVAMTDICNIFGLVKFYKKAISAGVKPIIGSTVMVVDGKNRYPVTLLCQNNQGYHHLTQLISQAYLSGQSNAGIAIEREWLIAKNAGLIVLSGGRYGDIGHSLLSKDHEAAKQAAQAWLSTFGDRFYIEVQRTGRKEEEAYLHAAVEFAASCSIPVVATHDVCFLHQEDFEAHEARVCIHSGFVLDDKRRSKDFSDTQYFQSSEAMCALFEDLPEAIENTLEIVKRCTVTLELGKPYLPDFPVPAGDTLEAYLKKEAENALVACFKANQIPEEQHASYQDRLRLELDVINGMGFPGYFLIVADFINWAKQQDIPVGPGRGSGAGSLVAFVLGITDLDPMEHDLLFERFLNPERISMPDFDIDFCMERRDEVIDYVAERYGREAVSQIITFGTMAAKAVVRDVGRVMGMPYGFVDTIAKLIPFEIGMTLEKALANEEALAKRYTEDTEVRSLIDLAKKLEGITRNAGKHAGGVVIAPGKLTDFTPLYCEPGGTNVVSQFDKDDVEAVGLVKFDFLGLRTLTIIHWAVQAINQHRPKKLDIRNIPLDDEKTFDLLKRCETTAVFQLESRGMKDLIRRLQPDSFDDITALVALFRPGPLQSGMVDDFIDRKHGRASVSYDHPSLEPILQTTYGVILYQEQVMQIAQVMGGYSLGGADILRRAMGKKKPEEMAKQRVVFIQGAKKQGIDERLAEHVFDLMEKFAGYGFNKSHSAAYALLSYQTAWLKAHYPAEFMAAVLSSDMDNTDKVIIFLKECEQMKLTVNPPNINISEYAFMVNDQGEIEYGLGAVKGVGESAIESIVNSRKDDGIYRSLFDFCERINASKVNKRAIEPLIFSGAMDDFNVHRARLFSSLKLAMQAADQCRKNIASGQQDLFALVPGDQSGGLEYIDVKPWADDFLLEQEKSALGYYLSGHPVSLFQDEIAHFSTSNIQGLKSIRKKTVVITGLLVAIRYLQTKRGRRMAIVSFEDSTGVIEGMMFGKVYEEYASDLEKQQLYVVKANLEDDDRTGGKRLVIEQVQTLDEARSLLAKRIVLTLVGEDQVEACLSTLQEILTDYTPGKCPVTIKYCDDQYTVDLSLKNRWHVRPNSSLIEKLQSLLGKGAVSVQYAIK